MLNIDCVGASRGIDVDDHVFIYVKLFERVLARAEKDSSIFLHVEFPISTRGEVFRIILFHRGVGLASRDNIGR